MIIKFNATITIETSKKPDNEGDWEIFNMTLEAIMEKALESNDKINISTAEVVMEEI